MDYSVLRGCHRKLSQPPQMLLSAPLYIIVSYVAFKKMTVSDLEHETNRKLIFFYIASVRATEFGHIVK